MDLLQLVARLSLDSSEYESGISSAKSGLTGLGSAVKSGAKVIAGATVAGVTAATAAVGALAKASLSGYGNYQQLVGGVQKLYGNMGMSLEDYASSVGKSTSEASKEWSKLETAQNLVLENAKNAFKTAGMSTSQYMETATSFSASLINSLNGDTVKAAKQTDVAMKAISDNWNTFGGDLGMIQYAYQGFAKQNYTMLDNLKLGYGGTKQEMERLIQDANEYAKANGQAADLSINSFSDIITAIDLIQQKQHIAGTTSREAATTIEGSFGSLKAAWDNLVTGFADPNADISSLMQSVIDAAKGAASNAIPTFMQALGGIATAINEIIPEAVKEIPKLVNDIGKPLVKTGASLITSFVSGMTQNLPQLSGAVTAMVNQIPVYFESVMNMIQEYAPNLISAGSELIGDIGEGLATGIPAFLESVLPLVLQFSSILRENAGVMIDAGLNLLMQLAQGIANGLPVLIAYLPQIISNIANIINDNAPKVLVAGVKIIITLVKGIISAIPAIKANFLNILKMIFDVFMAFNWVSLGTNLVTFIKNGITALKTAIPEALKNIGQTAAEWLSTIQWATLGADIIDLIVIGVQSLGAALPGALKAIATTAWNAFKAIPWVSIGKAVISTLATGISSSGGKIKSVIKGIIDKVKSAIKTGFDSAKKSAINSFKSMVDGVKKQLEKIKNTVKSVVDKIKGFFPLKIGKIFSGLKLPHFSVSGKAPFGIGGKGTKPSISVKWYKKAMEEPYLFSNATLFGAGESGDEMLYGRKALLDDIASAVNGQQESNLGRTVQITNYITVEGAEDPEDFTERFIRKLKLDMRTA